jgi:23S rRNA pseudouridine1911/1915/1917 synthase
MDQTYHLTVEVEDEGQRLDKWLSEQLGDISRSRIQGWIKQNQVLVNGQAAKANYTLAHEDEVTVKVPEPVEAKIQPESMAIPIVFEDNDVIVVNKPRGLVVHPAPGHYTGTLVNGLLHHCRDLSGINGVLRPGIVHRIDKDTTGLLMVAKNDKAHLSLAQQLKDHSVARRYLGMVKGSVLHDQGTVDAPIGRDSRDRQAMTVTENNSKQAVTHFVVKERFQDFSFLEFMLETGRTHQIRVHMKFIGHPLLGDPKYGPPREKYPIEGQALHAAVLGFVHPSTGKHLEFEAPVPQDMVDLKEWIIQREQTLI